MLTSHQYLEKYPISKNTKLLVLGTIHPHQTEDFLIPFFYGNRNSIWNILSDAFPGELTRPITLDGILSFLEKRQISVSDTIKVCQRIQSSALDKDLIPEILNHELIGQIRQSRIERILCTSGFGKNNAFKIFYEDILGLQLTPDIFNSREVLLPHRIFERPISLSALYSPSGSSNISLSKNVFYLKEKYRYKSSPRPVYDFKVDYYKKHFSL